jgi:hypothetical protein
MVRNDPSMLAAFLAGTGVPEAEIADIIRTQFPAAGSSSDQPVERKQ